MTGLFDSHCHLDPEHAAETVAAAQAAGVAALLTVGCDRASSETAIAVAAEHDGVWATVGLHPHEARFGVATIVDLLDAPKVLAVGECGLDYHYEHSPRADQRVAFAAQIGLAHERDLPLVVHTREAWDETFEILAAEGPPRRTIFHCFTGGVAEAERCLELGGYLSFSGIVTFNSAADVREAARRCPADRLLVETDSPYLAPVPHRGRRNQPAFVTHVVDTLATVRGETVEELTRTTWQSTVIAFSVTDS
jgi:TatD DNase family protein